MYKIDFYKTVGGVSPVKEFLDELESKQETSKDARVQYNQATKAIQTLEEHGTANVSTDVIKHIEDEVWELRPGKNRVFFFYYERGTYILLHQYVKKTQKTPRREINRAKFEINDYKQQKGK